MAGYYPDAFIDEVRERSDIVEVISEYMPLQRKGKKHWGLCPFHGEKTASFSVDQENQLYYCFGCHVGGNVFNFLREIGPMDFKEAVEHLAERARMEIPNPSGGASLPRKDKDRLYEALKEAGRFFYRNLYLDHGKQALEYLHRRGIMDNIIKRFGIGFTAPGGTSLLQHLSGLGFTKEELIDCNLVLERNDRCFDTFRNRVMFPIFDPRGRVIGFGGRVMGDEQPKYLNSSDTPVFNKRRNVYGLNFLKGREYDEIRLVEGYMDVVSLAQHGVNGCVATLGTALTPEQVRLVKKYSSTVTICYDGDDAGQRATQRAIQLCLDEGVEPRILVIPGGQDPDEYVRSHSRDAFLALRPVEYTAYRMDRLKAKYDMAKDEERAAYAEEAADVLKKLTPVQAERFIKRLAFETGFSLEVLRQQLGVQAAASQKKGNISPVRGKNKEAPVHVRAQQLLIACVLNASGVSLSSLRADMFTDEPYTKMYETLLRGGKPALQPLLDETDDAKKRAMMVEALNMQIDDPIKTMKDAIAVIEQHRLEEEIAELKANIDLQPLEQQMETIVRIQALTTRLGQLKGAG